MSVPILVRQLLGANASHPDARRLAEKATQTFLIGTPVRIEAGTGYVIESPAISATGSLIAGFCNEFAHNLATSGVPKTLTYGSVQNQPNASLIPVGAPISDGNIGLDVANDQTVFIGKLVAGQVSAQTDLGLIYGLTKQANGYWAVDKTKSTDAGGAVVEITGFADPIGTDGGKVEFKVRRGNQQLQAA